MKLKILLFCLLLLFPMINASIADVVISVEADGFVKISGTTDSLELLSLNNTYALTSKIDRFWYFDINLSGFDKLYYVVVLPKSYEVNNLLSINNTRISSKNNQINIVGYDLDNNLQISIKYSKDLKSNLNYNLIIYLLVALLFLLIIIYFYSFYFLKNKKEPTINFDLKNLNERQKKIIFILKKENEVSQNKLLAVLKIPKSSLSRNLSSLESKGYILKRRSGLTYLIKLRK